MKEQFIKLKLQLQLQYEIEFLSMNKSERPEAGRMFFKRSDLRERPEAGRMFFKRSDLRRNSMGGIGDFLHGLFPGFAALK